MSGYKAKQICPPNTFAHVIVAGDTYFSLARRYGTTVEAIMAANPGVNPNNLQIGQTVCIPRQAPFPPCPGGNYYVIRQGDTLYSIALRYNIPLSALQAANPTVDPMRLAIGQVICLPLATPPVTCPTGSIAYTVVPGDTLYSLSLRYGVTVERLIAANPGVNPNNLLVGQVLCIPTTM